MSNHGAAFLTSAYADRTRPTVLEVVAQEGLVTTLEPAFHQLMKVLDPATISTTTSTTTRWLARLLTSFSDELFLVANSGLQLHYLRHCSASFAENFYGLERIGPPARLRLSYLWLVLVPYAQRKLEQLFQQLREDEADGRPVRHSLDLVDKVRGAFVRLYPVWHALWTLADLALLVAYSLRFTGHHSVAAWMTGYQLAYLSSESGRLQAEQSAALLRGSRGLRYLLLSAVMATGRAVSLGLEVGSFFLQVVDHWYSRTDSSLKVATSMQGRVPGPPPPIMATTTAAARPGQCPLCRRSRRGSTVVAASGILYCYACIARHLRASGPARCPVSGLPADESQLVRVFEGELSRPSGTD